MADDFFKKTVDKYKGKKAKVKPLKSEPEGSKGVKLDAKIAKEMEELTGTDLSKVKLHTGGNSADLCKELGARAFTQGNDIYFGAAGDSKDKKLIAHELAHIVQNGSGNKMPKKQKGKALVTK